MGRPYPDIIYSIYGNQTYLNCRVVTEEDEVKMYETDTGLLQAPSWCQMRTEDRSTDAEREMMSKIERESRRKMSGRESADTGGIADAMHHEKNKYPCI